MLRKKVINELKTTGKSRKPLERMTGLRSKPKSNIPKWITVYKYIDWIVFIINYYEGYYCLYELLIYCMLYESD